MTFVRFQWDRVAAAVSFAIGLLALLLGYVGISGTVYPAEQLPFIVSGGIFGIFALGTAGVLYLSADMRDEWRKLDELDRTLLEVGLFPAPEDVETTSSTPAGPAGRSPARRSRPRPVAPPAADPPTLDIPIAAAVAAPTPAPPRRRAARQSGQEGAETRRGRGAAGARAVRP